MNRETNNGMGPMITSLSETGMEYEDGWKKFDLLADAVMGLAGKVTSLGLVRSSPDRVDVSYLGMCFALSHTYDPAATGPHTFIRFTRRLDGGGPDQEVAAFSVAQSGNVRHVRGKDVIGDFNSIHKDNGDDMQFLFLKLLSEGFKPGT